MALRLGGLNDLDPAAVPLPLGTEVTTRVDRVVDDGELRPLGASAKVVGIDGDRIDVLFLDGKRATYLRREVVPRKLGVARYAQRRAAAWDALAPNIVIDTLVGSRAWGVADEASDTDRRGVFVLPMQWTTGLVDPPLDLVSLDGSQTYWEVGKAIRQALRADPNTLEMLFADPHVIHPLGDALVTNRSCFLSHEIYGAFGRYALSQLDRLEHNQRLAEHRATIIGWLRDDPSLELDAAAERLAHSARVEAPTQQDAVHRARDYIKQLYRSMYDQGIIVAADWHSLRAAAKPEWSEAGERPRARTGLELPRDLRPKNAYNLIRLLDLAIRWLSGEPPTVRVSEQIRPTLIAIKKGEVPMPDVMALARELTPKLEAARQKSPLPRHPDVALAEKILRTTRSGAARHWASGSDDAWGACAAEPPEARFDE